MLVLTRRSGESVMVGDEVVVTVLDVRADTVRLGIKAPRHIAVHREEVYKEIRAANREAASPGEETILELRRRLRTREGVPVSSGEAAPSGTTGPAGPTGPTGPTGASGSAEPSGQEPSGAEPGAQEPGGQKPTGESGPPHPA